MHKLTFFQGVSCPLVVSACSSRERAISSRPAVSSVVTPGLEHILYIAGRPVGVQLKSCRISTCTVQQDYLTTVYCITHTVL